MFRMTSARRAMAATLRHARPLAVPFGILLTAFAVRVCSGSPCDDPAARAMVGVLFSRHEAVIATEIAGRLVDIAYELGQTVPAGAVIAHIDDRTLRETLAKAQATLESAESDSALRASERLDAEERLARRSKTADAYSAEELAQVKLARDRAIESLASAAANAKAQRASVAEIRLRLEAASIRAPFRGVIATRYQTPGTWLDVGGPVVRIVGEGELWVRFASPSQMASCLAPGSKILVHVPGLATELAGIVRHVSPEIDPASGLLTVEALLALSNSFHSRVHSGLAVRVRSAGGSQR